MESLHVKPEKDFSTEPFKSEDLKLSKRPKTNDMKWNKRPRRNVSYNVNYKISDDEMFSDESSADELHNKDRKSNTRKKRRATYNKDYKIPEDESSFEASYESEESTSDQEKKFETRKKKLEDLIQKRKKKKEDPMQKSDKELSEFEKKVQDNIKEKMALLEKLGITNLKKNFSESMKKPKPKIVRVEKPKGELPTRKSIRSSNVDIDLSEEAFFERAMAVAKMGNPLFDPEIRKSATTVKIGKAVKVIPREYPFKEAIGFGFNYTDFVSDFSNLRHKASTVSNEYSSMFASMRINKNQVAKVGSNRIITLAIHPMEEKIIIATGNSSGLIGLWNVNSEHSPSIFTPHTKTVTNLKFNPDKPSHLMSSSYDGTVRCGDLEKMMFTEVYDISAETGCAFFDFCSATTVLVAQGNGDVCIVDYRSKEKPDEILNCHETTLCSLSVHPVDKNYFVSADYKGFLRLWDLRKIALDPVVENHHHKQKILSACFSPSTGKHILTTSADNTACIFDSSKLGQPIKLTSELKNMDMCRTALRTAWLPGSDSIFMVGSELSNPKRIQVFDENMNNVFNFQDEYMDLGTSSNVFHPTKPIVVGAHIGGKVFVFTKND